MKGELSRRRLLWGTSLAAGAMLLPAVSLGASGPGGIEQRLRRLGISLPEVAAPVASYVPYVVDGSMIHVAGQLPFRDGELLHPGRLGSEVAIAEAQAAARQCAINILAAVRAACAGDLERVRRCVKLEGYVASVDSFTQQSTVLNAASDLMVEVLGERGRHTRVAVGVNTLPLNSCIEIAAVFTRDQGTSD